MSAITRLLPLATLPLALVCAASVFVGEARAAPSAAKIAKAEAEHQRLAEEMRKFASRNAWRGVEASYNKMLALQKEGATLKYDDHMLGVEAAREFGRVTQVHERLTRAHAVKPTPQTEQWIADIDASYRRVKLSADPRFEAEVALKPSMVPFDPGQRAAIGAAAHEITGGRNFEGLLPFGDYSFGDQTFTLTAETQELVRVHLIPQRLAGKRGGRAATEERSGLRVDLGPLYTSVGSSTAEGVQATSFGGFGVRAAVGWEMQLTGALGGVLQGGYHGLLLGSSGKTSAIDAARDLSAQPVSDAQRDAMSLFFVWGGLSYWPSDALSISVGPSWAGGRAATLGVTSDCVSGSRTTCDQSGASWGTAGTDEVAVRGTILAGGGALSVGYAIAELPGMRSVRGGLSLSGGAYSDLARLYPWGQLAFTLIPSV